MPYFGDSEYYQLTEQVKLCENQTRPDIKLEICMVICQMLATQTFDSTSKSGDISKEEKDMEKYIHKYLTNPEFRRKCNKRQALIEREPITYFGQDTPKGDEYDYDEAFEKEITEIQYKVTTFLANVMAFIQTEQGV